MDAARWAAVKPHFDRALDLDESTRAAWLATLRRDDPSLCRDLERLLEHHRAGADEQFLEGGAVPFPPRRPIAGRVLGAYTLLRPLGQGGMGTVWLAERNDGRFDRLAAIKFLNVTLNARAEDRFRREGRILGRLTHPHIAGLSDAGVSDEGQPYLVLEHVDGVPIDRYCNEQQLDIRARLRLFLDVLAAVAHAHANLIVHRDIKPSNVLVTGDGKIKLLDFGIAKLLDDDVAGAALTRDGDVAMTPQYATPEQVTGGAISTATDIYGLGVLLYVLAAGRHPVASSVSSPAELIKAIAEKEPARPSEAAADPRARRVLRGDLDTVIAKAMRKDPGERYASATAFADDLHRYLNHEPIRARRHSLAYRAKKFIRRNRWPLAAAATVFVLLGAALYVVNRERVIAERRFQQLRHLSEAVFDLDRQIRDLSGATAARKQLVTVSLAYLEGLAADARDDLDLAFDLAGGYARAGIIQGVPTELNLGDLRAADTTLQKGASLIGRVLASRPQDRVALERAAAITHYRMIIADTEGRDADALEQARLAVTYQERVLGLGPSPRELEHAANLFSNIALAYINQRRYDDGIGVAQRLIEVARSPHVHPRNVAFGLSLLANALRYRGDLEAALPPIREAREIVDRLEHTNDFAKMRDRYPILMREGLILGEDRAPSLERPDEALAPLTDAFLLVEAAAERDVNDSTSRARVGTLGREIGDILRHQDPAAALTYYDAALRRLGEIAKNVRAQRDRAVALAESAYALRALGRTESAKTRLDEAVSILQSTGDARATTVMVDDPLTHVERAIADHQAEVGQTVAAIAAYERLLAKVVTSAPGLQDDLRDAYALSVLYQSLARLHRASGATGRAADIESKRTALYDYWQRKLPGNPFVERRMKAN
jgi:serine/threonine-protein kinase